MDSLGDRPAAGRLSGVGRLSWQTAPAAAQPDQVLVTSTVVWSFIQLMIPAVVSAAEFPHIRALAGEGEALPAFQQYPLV